MEIQHFLTVCRRWWWIVVAAFVVTVAATVALTGTPTRQYQSSSTFVIQPQAAQEDDQVKALDALVQGGMVSETYASIARSRLIRDRAEHALGGARRTQGTTVSAEVVTGTRLIRLTVGAKDPVLARRLADSVSHATISYVNGLGDTYRLDPLDPPTLPAHPLPTKRSITFLLGGILGLMLGLGLAYVADYVWTMREAGLASGDTPSSRPSIGELLWTPRTVIPAAVGATYDPSEPGTEWVAPGKNNVDQPA